MNMTLLTAALLVAGYGDYEDAVKWISERGGRVTDTLENGRAEVLLSGCTDADLDHLDAFPKIFRLDAPYSLRSLYPQWRGNRITDAGMIKIARHTSLWMLKLDGAKITDKGVGELQKLDKLWTLSLKDTRITDVSLKTISKLSELINLELDETDITDDGLILLQSLKNLNRLSLSGCQSVTDKGIARLRKALPNCRIQR